MKFMKRPLSMLLSILLILSVFTIIPVTTANAAPPDPGGTGTGAGGISTGLTVTVQGFARKWVQAEVEDGDYLRLKDVYQNLIICRVNPNGGFDVTDYNVDQSAVWNRTGDLSLNGNKFTLNTWNDGQGHNLGGYWGTDTGRQGTAYIYLSTHETGGTDYNQGADFYAYTWETFTLTEHEATASTCEIQGNIKYYTSGDRYFIEDGNGGYTQVAEADTLLPLAAHTTQHYNEVPAGCVTAGMSEHYECSVCHKYFSDAAGSNEVTYASLVIGASGHAMTHNDEVPATCTTDGTAEHWHCSNCNKNFADANGAVELSSLVLPATGEHTLDHVAAVPATPSTDGNIEYWYCTECGKFFSDAQGTNEIAENSWVIPATAPVVKYYSLSLKDEIAINFYVYLAPDVYTGPITAVYSYGTGNYVKISLPATVVSSTAHAGANYKITCMVNARAMTDTVSLCVLNNGEEILTKDYSVVQYTEQAAEAYADRADLKKLLCDMLDYGAAVQNHFDYKTDDLANSSTYINRIDPDWAQTPAPAAPIANGTDISGLDGATYGISFAGSSMLVTSQTKVRLYFNVADADTLDGTTVTIDGTAAEIKTKGNSKYVEFVCSSAKKIFDDHTVTFVNGSNNASFTYSAKSYYNIIVGGNYNANLQNVLKTMYVYSESAN